MNDSTDTDTFEFWQGAAVTIYYQPKAEPMTITLPYPPSSNRYWRVANNRTYKSAEAKQYQELVGWTVKAAGVQPLAGNVSIKVNIYRPRKSGDLDNRLKIVIDSLNGIAYEDDRQIVEIHARRFDDKNNPRVEIEVTNCLG